MLNWTASAYNLTLFVVQLSDSGISVCTKNSTKYVRLGSRVAGKSSVYVKFILEFVIHEVIRQWQYLPLELKFVISNL